MDSKNKEKVGQKGSVNHSKPAARPGTEQARSGSGIERQEGERVQAPKQGEAKKTEPAKSGKK